MNMNFNEQVTLLNDFYEYTMASGFHQSGIGDKIVYFDLYFRTVPDGGGFAIACGLERALEYVRQLRFSESDIAYLRSKNCFSDQWLKSLENFRFTGDIWAVPEGTVVFPGEPLMTVRARAEEAQIIETFLLLCINHQTLIATKANRVVRAAEGRPVMEFGARRAQGASAAFLGARAAYIAGAAGTSCTLTDKLHGTPAMGTMAHSWIQIFEDEYEAFKTYAQLYPDNCCLLVDTYNTLKSGIPNAIRVFKEVLWPQNIHNYSIRIDSGDLSYLTRKAREMLDAAGCTECKIVVSDSLDEYRIRDLVQQGGFADSFGVGERLITSKSDPVLGGVYKLVAVEEAGEIVPRIKVSENVEKITTPHFKKIYRLYDRDTGKALADLLCVHDEVLDDSKPLEIFDPIAVWKRKTLENFTVRELLVQVMKNGEVTYDYPSIEQLRSYCAAEVDSLWDEVKRFDAPHKYYVDMSQKLWDIRQNLLMEAK